jgi:leader peptidase (prepilin peptidase)/N-methyltransferase
MFFKVFVLFLLGAAMGSFSLAWAYRLRHKLDWVRGRSECERCKHPLAPSDLIPIISWLILRGRCRYCKKPISPQTILSEVGLGSVFALSFVAWPASLSGGLGVVQFCLWLVITVILSALFWYDVNWMILPSKLVYPLVGLSLVHFVLSAALMDSFGLVDVLMLGASIAVGSGLFLLFYLASGGKWIGFGDVRLGVAIGLLVERPAQAAMTIFLASVIGSLVVLPTVFIIRRKIVSKLPFGPLLIVALVIIRLFGQRILNWYLALAGIQ